MLTVQSTNAQGVINLTYLQSNHYTSTTWKNQFSAFLLWEPNIPAGSTPVPIAYNFWSVYGQAQLVNNAWQSTGITQGAALLVPMGSAPAGYPTWASQAGVPPSVTCGPTQ